MNEPDPTLPSEVRRTMHSLYERTDVMPTARREGMTLIHLEHINDRVRMTQRYVRPVGSKRWRWHSSELWENGTQRKIASGFNHYVAIFEGTEETFLGRKKIELPPLTPVPEDEIPLGVLNTLRKIEKRLRQNNATTQQPLVGLEGERYAIQMAGPLATVRLYYEAHDHGTGTGRCYREDHKDPLRVVRHDGVDMTQEVMDSPELYAALMAGDTSVLNTGAPQAPTTDTHGPRSNAVEARRASVMRV